MRHWTLLCQLSHRLVFIHSSMIALCLSIGILIEWLKNFLEQCTLMTRLDGLASGGWQWKTWSKCIARHSLAWTCLICCVGNSDGGLAVRLLHLNTHILCVSHTHRSTVGFIYAPNCLDRTCTRGLWPIASLPLMAQSLTASGLLLQLTSAMLLGHRPDLVAILCRD